VRPGAILFVLGLVLGGCATVPVEEVPVDPDEDVIWFYDPCYPPAGNRHPPGPADPWFKGHAFNKKPTACI